MTQQAAVQEAVAQARGRLPDPEVRPVMSVVEAGAWLGLGRASSYEAVRAGTIPAVRCGRRLVVPTAKFRELLGL